MRVLCAAFAAMAFLGAGHAIAQQLAGPIEIESMLEGRKTITPDWQTINAQPFGSRGNPVRVHTPSGQRAYLQRLACGGGATPGFHRVGSFGAGPYTTIIDGYEVDCGSAKSMVFMDMYHPGYVERRAVPGFTIRDP